MKILNDLRHYCKGIEFDNLILKCEIPGGYMTPKYLDLKQEKT